MKAIHFLKEIQDFSVLKSTLSCSCCSCKHNFSTFILNPDQDLWFILPYPVLIEHESASIHSIYASNPRDAHILHLSWTCLKSCLIFFLARPKVLTKHCLALVHKSSWIYSKIPMYFPKMYKSTFKQLRVAASTANPLVNSQYLNYTITLLLQIRASPGSHEYRPQWCRIHGCNSTSLRMQCWTGKPTQYWGSNTLHIFGQSFIKLYST